MELIWRQTQLAWIATQPEYDDGRGEPLKSEIANTLHELCKHLLSLDGQQVCIPFVEEPLCDVFRIQGVIANFVSIKHMRRSRSDCHANCAKLWKSETNKYQIMTGYGLSDDGMWRRHTWLIDNKLTVRSFYKAETQIENLRFCRENKAFLTTTFYTAGLGHKVSCADYRTSGNLRRIHRNSGHF